MTKIFAKHVRVMIFSISARITMSDNVNRTTHGTNGANSEIGVLARYFESIEVKTPRKTDNQLEF